MTLPPELTARIEKDIRRAIAKHTYPSLGGPVTEVEDAMRELAEPLHKEIEAEKQFKDDFLKSFDWTALEKEHHDLTEFEATGLITNEKRSRLEELQSIVNLKADIEAPWDWQNAQDLLVKSIQGQLDSLKAELADTEASRQEYIRLFHEQERENDALDQQLRESNDALTLRTRRLLDVEAQLAEAKKAAEDKDDQRTELIMHHVFMDSLLDDLGAPKHPGNDPERPKYGPYGRLRAYAESIGIKATMWEPSPKPPTY